MRHAEALELIELAAIEPDGLRHLTDGDAPETSALRDHLASCASCRAALEATRADVAAIHDALRDIPAAELRGRTLDSVGRLGRPRAAVAEREDAGGKWWLPQLGWASVGAGLAAAALIGAVVVGVGVQDRLTSTDAAIAEQRTAVAGLTRVSEWILRLGADADAARATLAAADGGTQSGSVVFSSQRDELVMVASGLPEPPAGVEYRCWVETADGRVPIGRMYRAGALSYWVGELDTEVAGGNGLTFGVSLVEEASEGVDGDVVLIGST